MLSHRSSLLLSCLIWLSTANLTVYMTTTWTATKSAQSTPTPAPPTSHSQNSGPSWQSLTIRCAAYTPWDAIDADYRAANPIPATASGRLVSEFPFGIAAPREFLGCYVELCVPGFPPYDVPRVWRIDDTGGIIRRVYRETGEITMELRFTDPEQVRQFGRRTVSIKLIDRDSRSIHSGLRNTAE
jgi:hypothetical protein